MKKLTSMLVLGATALSFGQNARTDAMGGTSVQGDMSRILTRGAVEMLHYKNNAQMSATSAANEYNFIGTKSIGDNIVIGATVNADRYGQFYTRALTANNYWSTSPNGNANLVSHLSGTQNKMPNLLLGLELSDAFALGAELYLDANRYKAETDAGGDPASSSETTEYISNKGFIVSAEIGDELLITPVFGMGFPRNKHEISFTQGTTTDFLVETEQGITLDAGADVAWPAGDVKMEAGFAWGMEKYQFTYTGPDGEGGTETIKDDTTFSKNSFHLLYGVTGTFNDKLLWVVEYRGDLDINRTNTTTEAVDPAPKTEVNDDHKELAQEFAIAFERPVKGFWIFDGLTPRAGFVYANSKTKNVTTVETGDKNDSKDAYNFSDGMNLTTGFGLTKGRATIDVAANFGEWDASFTGPTTASATLTVDFGKDTKKASRPAPFAEEESGSFGIE